MTHLLTTAEVCQQLRCSRSEIHRLRAQGKLQAVRLGRAVRFTQAQVDEAVARMTEPLPPAMRRVGRGR